MYETGQQLAAFGLTPAFATQDRRAGSDRRLRRTAPWHRSSFWGGQRYHGRRQGEAVGVYVDRYDPRYRFIALAIMILSCLDGFLTLALLNHGSEELNPVMAVMLNTDTGVFFAGKLVLTSFALVALIPHHRFLWLRCIPVRSALTAFCVMYAALVTYETSMLLFAI